MTATGLTDQPSSRPGIQTRDFGTDGNGRAVHLYTLRNVNAMEAAISDHGATVVSIHVPDRSGQFADVVLGFDDLNGYLRSQPYFGATIGRYANRIAHGRFTLHGVEYQLPQNNGENSLHGGLKGFDKVLWTATSTSAEEPSLELTYLSKDGEEGYPGNLSVTVRYTLTSKDELRIEYAARTDKDTILNLTNHSYFNLSGAGSGDILSHLLEIAADRYTPIDSQLIPTGQLQNVENTPFDFRKPTTVGSRIDSDNEQLKRAGGYDHDFVLDGGGALSFAARVSEPITGRVLEVFTSQVGIQFYSGNFLNGTARGKGGVAYQRRSGLCLETQHFPDSPNHANFPSTVLKAGEEFQSTTVYRFSVAP
jgi:aldose 1-epimerase